MASLVLPKSGDSTRAGVFPVSPSAAAGNIGNRPTEFRWSSVPLLGPEGQGSAHHVLELLEGIVPPEEPTQEIDDPVAVRDGSSDQRVEPPELLVSPSPSNGRRAVRSLVQNEASSGYSVPQAGQRFTDSPEGPWHSGRAAEPRRQFRAVAR